MSDTPPIRVPPTRKVCAGLLALALLPLIACERNVKPGQIGGAAPNFTVNDGQHNVTLSNFKGKTVVLNFWATWCAPCVEEMPSLQQLQEQMPGVQVVAISVDEDDAAYRKFLEDHRILFLTARDANQKSNAAYGSLRYPETYIIDKNGTIRRKFIGPQDWTNTEVVDYLKKL